MSKVLVDRELLERICAKPYDSDECLTLDRGSAIADLAEMLAQPAEAEVVELQRLAAEFDAAPDDAEWEPPHPIFQMARDLDRVTAALSAVTAERDGLAAARMAYANEFAPDENGDPDVGNVHANIRALKAERDRLLSDNASLRGSCKALGEENKQLKRENKRQGRTIAAMDAKEA